MQMGPLTQAAIWQVKMRLRKVHLRPMEAVLTELGDPASPPALASEEVEGEEKYLLSAYYEAPPSSEFVQSTLEETANHLGIKDFSFKYQPVADCDWVAESQSFQQPVRVGKLFIHPSHWEGEHPVNAMPLVIEASLAFGTGGHETTYGCLEALNVLHAKSFSPERVADIGCGSAILSMAAHRLFSCPVVAGDNDAKALKIAKENLQINRIPSGEEGVVLVEAAGLNHSEYETHAPFDLILMNILATPLIDLAGEAARHASEKGWIILSGLLDRQEAAVLSAYKAEGFILRQRFRNREWPTLLLTRDRG